MSRMKTKVEGANFFESYAFYILYLTESTQKPSFRKTERTSRILALANT